MQIVYQNIKKLINLGGIFMNRKIALVLVMVMAMSIGLTGVNFAYVSYVEKSNTPVKETTLTCLIDWNGAGVIAPSDPVNNPVANAIKEKTGVTLQVEYATTAENEKLNLLFASGDMPDIINGPFWGGSDTCTTIFKKAAKQGLLTPLDEYVNKYSPFLKSALTKGLAKDFVANDLEDPDYGGKHYFLPWQTARTNEDITNWAFNVFARQDILNALKVKASSIKTSEDLYSLLKKIKKGNFKDINGKAVIPSGSWANGWAYQAFLNSYSENALTEFTKINGKYKLGIFSPLLDKQVKYMRKLVNDGLFDMEAFRQNDTKAKEKMAAGKIAVFGSHYVQVKTFFDTTLYKTNPKMKYVPLGPILDATNKQCQVGQKQLDGRAGSPIIALSSTCKDPEAAIKLIDFLNSDSGLALSCYGVKGTHYDLVNGKPKLKSEWQEKYNKDPQLLRNEGIQSVYNWFITLDNRMSNWGETAPGSAKAKDLDYEEAKKISPNVFVSGFRVNYFKDQYSKVEEINSLTNPNTQRDAIEKAYFAKTDSAALKILNDYRNQLIKGGILDYEKFINTKAAQRKDIIY
jgi:putative aldouronate transport system substrate-binding protein